MDVGDAVVNLAEEPEGNRLESNLPPSPPHREEKQSQDDTSAPLFAMYHRMTEHEDNQLADRWQKDAKGVIIFTGLFSASVAVLLAVTVLDLKSTPQDTSAFYLQQMYELQFSVASNTPLPSAPATPPPFSAPTYIIWVNSLWFLSLTISLTCAMLATLLQQWARRYLRITQPARHIPHARARTRAFYADGVDKLHFSWAVGVIPTLIHLSLFLFFAGILIYLFNVNHTVFYAVVGWVGTSVTAYIIITFLRPFRPSSPYFTPLTSIVGLLWPIEKKAKRNMTSAVDGQILKWIFDSILDDHELVEFFQGIPGFCRSLVVVDPLNVVISLGKERLDLALEKLLKRTWPSILLANSDNIQRLVDFVKVADILCLPRASLSILKNIFLWDWHTTLRSVEVGQALTSRGSNDQQEIGLCIQCVIAGIISNVQERDDRWIALAADQLGLSGDVIRDYLRHGKDNVLLANLTDITRKIIESSRKNPGRDSDMANASLHIFPTLLNFDIQKTLPKLQRDFRNLCLELNEVPPTDRDSTSRNIRDKLSTLCDISYASDGLPPDWEVAHNLGGDIYYIDHNTKRTTWTRPSSYPGPGNDGLPQGWEVTHGSDEDVFYVDHNTKRTTPTCPSPNPGNNDWEVRHDARMCTFYIDHKTGKTTWTHPSNLKPSPYVAPMVPATSREVSQRAPDQFVTDQVLPEAVQRPTAVVASSSRTAEGDGRSGTSQAQIGEQPSTTVRRLDSSSAPPVDVHSPTDLSIDPSAGSLVTPQAASESVILPTTPPLGAHHDSQEPRDSSEMEPR